MPVVCRTPAFWNAPPSVVGELVSRALIPCGALLMAAARVRRWWATRTVPDPLPVPLLCVGNAVVGGAGKTPVVMAVVAWLREQHPSLQVHVLTRGYGGTLRGPVPVDAAHHSAADVGDEALLLASTVHPGVTVWAARDRRAAAHAAVAAGADLLVMDDGFQYPYLRPDAVLLVVDGATGIGNGRVLPAGPLREPWPQALARLLQHAGAGAAAVVLMGGDRTGLRATLPDHLPVLDALLVPDTGPLPSQPVVAFAGIGRPEKFFATVRRHGQKVGQKVVECVPFPDHYPYREADMQRLAALAEPHGAGLLTTAKDAVRLPPGWAARVEVLRVQCAFRDPVLLASVLQCMVQRSDTRRKVPCPTPSVSA